MSVVHSFPPIADGDPHTLVLGSMPGTASLAADRYYAHPRNAFWPIMGELFGAGLDREYGERIDRLCECGIAVWDVLKLCTRSGSLDSAIIESSIVTNDFAGFFDIYPSIDRVFFNGAKAEQSYRRYVAPTLELPEIELVKLPSTSPAHASLTFEHKLAAWRSVGHPATTDPA